MHAYPRHKDSRTWGRAFGRTRTWPPQDLVIQCLECFRVRRVRLVTAWKHVEPRLHGCIASRLHWICFEQAKDDSFCVHTVSGNLHPVKA